MDPNLTIREIGPADEQALAALFAEVADDEATGQFFNPFPMSAEQARLIACELSQGDDVYYGAFEGSRLLGFGMLRGWSEGYANPAFGVVVSPSARGRGVAGWLIAWGADAARGRGSSEVMLKVHDDNVAARKAYERAGFVFGDERADNGQLVGRLGL